MLPFVLLVLMAQEQPTCCSVHGPQSSATQTTQSSVLSPQSSATQSSFLITVTAARTPERLADTPASVVILSQKAIVTSASPAVDDALRQVPGFTLFRR